MNISLFPLLVASVFTFISIVLLRPFAIKINLLDTPSDRKKHEGSVPLIGGLAIFLGISTSIFIFSDDLNQFNHFLFASSVIITLGVIDDHQNISVTFRLILQLILAVFVVTIGGININSLGGILGFGEIMLGQWSYLLSIIAIIVGMNAVNMADGIHGLAGGNSLITFLAILLLSFNNYSIDNIIIVSLFCSVLPVFLIHNLCIGLHKKYRIFMGDSGSMFLGLSIVWILIDFSQGEGRSFSPVIALWLFANPLLEITASVLRRITLGLSPFKADLFHTHHLLIKLGLSEKNTLLLILSGSLIMALIGILGEIYFVSERKMFFGFLIVFVIYFTLQQIGVKKIRKLTD